MKITLPESIADITLGQYQRFTKLTEREDLSEHNYNKRVVEIFTELKFSQVDNISQKDYEEIILQIISAFNVDAKFKHRFKIGKYEFGFIPNLDKITTAEYVDIQKAGVEVEDLHKLMAVLFRPISGKDLMGNYKIEPYKIVEDSEFMKQMPMNVVNGALFFFRNLAIELQNSILRYTNKELMKAIRQQTILKSGGGTQPSLN